jgi:hypothetical protein
MMATFAGWLIPWDLFIRQAIVIFVAMLVGGGAGRRVESEQQP